MAKKKETDPVERTLAIIKPDAVQAGDIGNIIAAMEKKGFRIVTMRMAHLTKWQAEEFYEVHRERPFYGELTDFMSRGPCVGLILERAGAIARWRKVMGDTDSRKAARGTIRCRYGADKQENAVHGSDAPETAAEEIEFFFPMLGEM